jgi:hypothetical protein
MEIIKQHEDNREGNDCLIEDCIVIMRCHGKYIVANFRRTLGWCDNGIQTRGWKEFDNADESVHYYNDMIKNRYKY